MEMKKAKSQQQKMDRANGILDAAESLFISQRGELPSASQIAKAASVAKGTVYIYFSSKEAIFLTLLERHIQKWLQDVDHKMKQYEQNDLNDICQYLIDYWVETPVLGQLYRICDAVLEPNVDDKFYFGYQTRKVNEIKRLVPTISELNEEVAGKEWNLLLQKSLVLIAAAWVQANPHNEMGAEKYDFKQVAVGYLTPFWRELLEKIVEPDKPKSGWRKLLGS